VSQTDGWTDTQIVMSIADLDTACSTVG